jgi:hypothetical protein
MNASLSEIADSLRGVGWAVREQQGTVSLPQICAERYPWLPRDVIAFLTGFEAVVSPGQTAWLTTRAEILGESDSAFSWNQWEQDSLSAAKGDPGWQRSIRYFWDMHFPIMISVKSGYAYVAIRKDQSIVVGEEPEFEETEMIAENFSSFLLHLAGRTSGIDRLI